MRERIARMENSLRKRFHLIWIREIQDMEKSNEFRNISEEDQMLFRGFVTKLDDMKQILNKNYGGKE